jgi:CubicO group peptidase (beta-lactamase class C family)
MSQPPFDIPALIRASYAHARVESENWQERGLMQGFPPAPDARVTRRNFMRPPFNSWSFQHINRLLPTIDVPASAQPHALPCAEDASLAGLRFRSVGGAEVSLAEHLAASHTDGFVVLQQGKVVFEHYSNGHTPSTRHIMFSVTKSLIGTLAEWMVHEGRLDESALAQDIVGELRGSAFGDATVRQLMDMAVGVHYTENYEDPLSESSQFGFACGLTPPYADDLAETPAQYAGLDSLYSFLPRLRKKGEHGGFFNYVTAVTEVLAWVMERATGVAAHELLSMVWARLGCERDGYFIADALGRGVAGAGFSATLRDMARFGQMLLNRGQVEGEQVIPSAVVDALLAGSDPAIFASNPEFGPMGPFSYKSQWYVLNDKALLAIGIHGQQLYVDFQAGMVAVKQSSPPDAVAAINIDSLGLMNTLTCHFASLQAAEVTA